MSEGGLNSLLKTSEGLYKSSREFLDNISARMISGAVALETIFAPSDLYAGSNERIIPIPVHPFVYIFLVLLLLLFRIVFQEEECMHELFREQGE